MKGELVEAWAVGDVAAFPLGSRGGLLGRVEHVHAARLHAKHAVASMLDPAGTPNLAYLPFLYMRAFEGTARPVLWQLHGLVEGDAQGAECVVIGSGDPKLGAFWVKEGQLVGLLLESGSPEENALLPGIAATRPRVTAAELRGGGSLERVLTLLADRG